MKQEHLSEYLFGKVPPSDPDIEQAVLGALIMDSSALDTVIDLLNPDIFYVDANRMVCEAIVSLAKKSLAVDMLTVTQEMKLLGTVDKAGGPFYVVELTSRVASSANIRDHISIIRGKYIQRRLGDLGMKLTREAYEETMPLSELLQSAEKGIFEVTSEGTKKKVENIADVVAKSLRKIEDAKKVANGLTGVPCGFTTLDRVTGGWQDTDLIILAARPSQGKTALGLNIAKGAAEMGYPVAFFSLEMSNVQLVNRLLAADAEINGEYILRGTLQDYQWMELMNSGERVSNLPLYIDDTSSIGILELKSKCRKLKMDYGIKLIVVDYLQLMTGIREKGDSRNTEVGSISAGLKAIAKELEVPVIALSQLSRANETRGGSKRPMLSDLRESGCLAAETKIFSPLSGRDHTMAGLVDSGSFSVMASNLGLISNYTAKKCFSTGKKDLYKMTLINGQEIVATLNHKFLTDDGWKPLSDLQGQRVAIPINYKDGTVDIPDEEVCLVGHFLANGSVVSNQPVRCILNIEDVDLEAQIQKDALACTDGIRPRSQEVVSDRGSYRVLFLSMTARSTHGVGNPISDIFRKYNLFDVRSGDKFIPDSMFYLNYDKTCLLLKSLFSGDGCACITGNGNRKRLSLSYSSKSKELISGIQRLLNKIGIISFFTKVKNNKGHEWYLLAISNRSSKEIFVENVGFWNKRKNDKMLEGWSLESKKKGGWTKYKINESQSLCFMPVKSIEFDRNDLVYDIEVPGPHNFVANGIVAHNSIEQDCDLALFIHRPEYYGITEDENGNSLKGVAEIIFAKHRNGAVGGVELRFKPQFTKFTDVEEFNFEAPPPITVTPSKNEDENVPF